MKKETLLEIVLGTVGGLVFSLGMCMGLIKEWNMLIPGIIVASIGGIVLLCIIPIYKKSHPKKEKKKIDKKVLAAWITGIIGALIMGLGMSMCLNKEGATSCMVIGIIIGIVGLIICILDYPIYAYIKDNKNEIN